MTRHWLSNSDKDTVKKTLIVVGTLAVLFIVALLFLGTASALLETPQDRAIRIFELQMKEIRGTQSGEFLTPSEYVELIGLERRQEIHDRSQKAEADFYLKTAERIGKKKGELVVLFALSVLTVAALVFYYHSKLKRRSQAT